MNKLFFVLTVVAAVITGFCLGTRVERQSIEQRYVQVHPFQGDITYTDYSFIIYGDTTDIEL